METTQLTKEEIEQLRKAIEEAETYRNKKLKELTLTVMGAIGVGLIAGYWEGMTSWAIVLGALASGIVLLSIFSFGWYLAGRPIKKMEEDLQSGMKRIGTSEIGRINIFNRSIRLTDGTIVYEDDTLDGKWRKGDRISYQKTISGEHLFECKRLE